MAVDKTFTSAVLLCYLLLYSGVQASSVSCPSGWTLSSDSVSCYKAVCGNTNVINGAATVDTACNTLSSGATAASIISVAENKAVTDSIAAETACATTTQLWLGLKDNQDSACDGVNMRDCLGWVWTDSRAVPNPAAPNAGFNNLVFNAAGTTGADCGFITMDTGKWGISACNTDKGYVCRVAPTANPSTKECLSGEDHVVTEKAGEVKIKDLAPGDKVMSMNDAGEIIYDEIFLITHASPDYRTSFTSINVANITLHLTDKHMIIVDGIEKSADQVKPNDKIYFYNKFTGNMMIDEVESVGNQEMTGIYNPVTKGGRLLVNGVMTSAYPRVYQPITAGIMHNALWGVRMLYNVIPDVINAGYNVGDGMPVWVKYAVDVLDS